MVRRAWRVGFCSGSAVMQLRRSQRWLKYRLRVALLRSEAVDLHLVRCPQPVDPDAVVAKVNSLLQVCCQGTILSFRQFALEHASLYPV